MLSNTLNTNEIKNSAGTEIEFQRISSRDRQTVFAMIGESPSLPNRLTIGHTEVGSGLKKRRRSVIRFDKTVMSTVDTTLPVTASAYTVLDSPIGALVSNAELINVLAQLQSFLATTGAATTVLLDGTGNGASSLINGSI